MWKNLFLEKQQLDLAAKANPIEVLAYIFRLSDEVERKVIVMLWSWWGERNRRREGDGSQEPSYIAKSVVSYASEVGEVYTKEKHKHFREKKRWEKPQEDTLKINCDGAFHADTGAAGWGFVIRDADGDVALAGKGRLDHVDSFQAEAISCLQGVQAAIDLGARSVILETDASTIKDDVYSNSHDLAAGDHPILELTDLLKFNFAEWKLVHVMRECNRVAHALAAWGYECAEDEDPDVESLPHCIHVIIADDGSALE